MKYTIVLLFLCAACNSQKQVGRAVAPGPLSLTVKTTGKIADKSSDKELEKIAHWFEQMDAVWRESLWVIKKERPPQSKSIFGKVQRALLMELKQKLANKSLFSCDSYSMSRSGGALGVPQTADVFHKCSVRENFAQISSWSHPTANELEVSFQANNLMEVLGVATAIFNPKIHCKLKSNDQGLIQNFQCENLMVDYDVKKSQVLKFTRFEFEKTGRQILHLRAEVLENLEAVRKIESDVPMDGAIEVTETVLKAPYVAPTSTPLPVGPPPPLIQIGVSPDPNAPLDPNAQAGGSIRPSQVPVRKGAPGARSGPGVPIAPIPASDLGVPGDEGEYHEGGALPAEEPQQPLPNTR